ncbi:MAG: GNAT family N-acetyltransferase [Nitrosomonadaceae bacterium]
MNFNIEAYSDLVDDLDKLYAIAVEEILVDCPLKHEVDHKQFIDMDEMGLLQIITAREDGELVGFHISTIANDIFYKGKKTAFVMLYFMKKENRGGGNALSMFEYADKVFKGSNIDRAFMSRKIHLNNEKLFDKLGFNQIESNYEKYYA